MASKIASQGYCIPEASSSGLCASANFGRNMNHSSGSRMDIDSLLHQLNDPSSNQRVVALDQLLDVVRHSANGDDLLVYDHVSLFQSLALALRDPDWEIRNKALNVLSEATIRDGIDVDRYMIVVLPHLVPCLGDSKVTVRRSAIQCIHTYMKCTTDFVGVIDAVIRFGLEAEDIELQRDACISVPLLLTPDFALRDFFGFVQALTKKLLAREEVVVQAGLSALKSIRGIIGEAKFTNHVNRLSPALQRYYFRIAAHEQTVTNPTLSKSSLDAPFVSFGAIESLPICDDRSPELSRKVSLKNDVDRQNIAFGVIPNYIMEQLQDTEDFRMRALAVDDLKTAVTDISDVNQIIPHLGSFLSFLLSLLDDANFKITTVTLEILILLVDRLGIIFQPHSKQVVTALSKRLGDNKIVVRQAVMRLALLLMQNLKPQTILSLLSENLRNRNSRVRQETLNIIICALLTFPSTDFDQALICHWVAPSLTDAKRAVRHAALECMAVLAQGMGAGHLQPIVDAVEESVSHPDGTDLLKAVQARLARRQLPRYTVDGLIEYSSPVPTSATHRRSAAPVGADSELVLAASSSAGSARARPAELVDLEGPVLNIAEPQQFIAERRRVSTGKVNKTKLPWEQEEVTSSSSTPSRSRTESPTQNGAHPHVQVPPPARIQRKLEPLSANNAADGASSTSVTSVLSNNFRSQQQPELQSARESTFTDVTDNVCPIPTRPALVRSAGKRRGIAPLVPPIPISSQSSMTDKDESDSGIQSAAASATRRGSIPLTVTGDIVTSSSTTPPESDNEENEMYGSLTTIRNSASRKKAMRVFEEAERRASNSSQLSMPSSSAVLRHSKSDTRLAANGSHVTTWTKEQQPMVRTKYSPYSGATFRENPNYDGTIIGRRVGDDNVISQSGSASGSTATLANLENGLTKAWTVGSVQMIIGNATSGGTIGVTASVSQMPPRPKERRRLSMKGALDSGRVDDERGNGAMAKAGNRRGSKPEIPYCNPPSGIIGIGFEKTSSLSEDDDAIVQDPQSELVDRSATSEKDKLCRQDALAGCRSRQKIPTSNSRSASGSNVTSVFPCSKPPVGNTTPKRPKIKNTSESEIKSPSSIQSISCVVGDSLSVSSEDPETAGPFKNPDKIFPETLQLIAANDWQSKCQGLGLVRRLAYHHKEVLLRDLHPCVLGVTQELKNLRSQVTRHAIQTLSDMFLCLGRSMDADLDLTVRMLLHKSGDSSTFIREDVEMALERMVDAVTPQRAVAALIQGGANHRNMQVRRVCALNLSLVCDRMGPGRVLSGVKEVTDRILPAAAQFTLDGSPETRWFGRRIFYGLLQHQDFSRMCQRFIPANTWRNMHDIVGNLRTKGLGECPTSTPSAGMRRSESLTRGNSAGSLIGLEQSSQGTCATRGSTSAPHSHQQQSSSPVQSSNGLGPSRRNDAAAEEAKRLVAQLNSTNWSVRYSAVAELVDWSESDSSGALRLQTTRILDAFVLRLSDSNSKVNLFALRALEQMLPALRELPLGPVISVMVQHTATNLASKNQEITRTASRLLDAFIEHLDTTLLVQPYVQAVTAANSRVKPEMIDKLTILTDRLSPRKPRLVTLHVLPELWRLLISLTGACAGGGSVTTGCRGAVQSLVAVLHDHMRDDLMEFARTHVNSTPRMLQLLTDMTDNVGRGT